MFFPLRRQGKEQKCRQFKKVLLYMIFCVEELSVCVDSSKKNSVLDTNYYHLVNDIFGKPFFKKPLAFVRTYGCQQNISDSERIKGVLQKLGYEFTDDENISDLIIFNTCAIRQNAQNRVLGNIGILKKIKSKNPNVKIIVCGCMTEQDYAANKIKNSYPFVDVVLGTKYLGILPEVVYNLLIGSKTQVHNLINMDNNESVFEGGPINRDSKIKAWVPIMYGCDNFCSYCVVPYVRGREKSREPENIVSEVKILIDKGYKDITLLGQNVNSYGKHLREKVNFSDLLEMLDSLNGEFRIRFMTSHPKDATKKLIDVIAQSRHICSHIHLPFQSGNNRILKLMNRQYTRESYLEIVNYAKQKMPNVCLSSDIIVGFPGETYEEFLDTVSLIKEVKFTSLFTFIYSPRNGTPASLFEDSVPYEEKSKWFSYLLKEQENVSLKIYEEMVGKNFEILVESKINDQLLVGKTAGNILVEVETSQRNLIGKFINVKIINYNKTKLKAKIN
jgi:tRNA-2-methylthio-N6-dimethylallyladenosine synthase